MRQAQFLCPALQPLPILPRRVRKDCLARPPWWTSERKTRTVCADSLQVRWTLIPKIAPQPWIACSGCGGLRAFQSSDKIRLNANGRKLDAWLIYKCTGCDKTWNRTIFERKNVRDIDSATLEALQSNDPDWIRAETFNLEALRRKSQRISEFAEFEIRKELLRETPDWKHLEIELSISFPTSARLDRLLASELRVSRSQLNALHEFRFAQNESGSIGYFAATDQKRYSHDARSIRCGRQQAGVESAGHRRRRSGIADPRRAKLRVRVRRGRQLFEISDILQKVASARVRPFCIVDKRPVS